jgi:hypothetical protein
VIDFDRFWAEAGCFPGMTREQAEAQLQQMGAWLESMPGASGKFDMSAVPGMSASPGVTEEQIADWEHTRQVQLPDVLRRALMRQDGGFVRDTQFRILPLEEIDRPDDEFWEWVNYEKEEVPDRNMVFQFAEDESGGVYLLNFAAGAGDREPGIFVHHSDPGDMDRCSKSITKFFDGMLQTFDSPSVDWSKAEALAVIARETIDLSPLHGGKPASKEQVLGRQGKAIVLFTREQTPVGETYSQTTLPEPLLHQAAMLQTYRPAPVSTFSLMLQPENIAAIVHVESQRTGDGRWKNSTSHGNPVCVLLESADRGRLEALRRELFGKKAADRAQAQEVRQQKMQSQLDGLSMDERQAAMYQMMLKMREQLANLRGAGPTVPADAPPELAALQESLQQKLREAEERAKEHISKHPLGPEIMRQFGEINPEILRLFGTFMGPDAEE